MGAKFKVGDRVRAGKNNGWVADGSLGTVAENDNAPYVDWDSGHRYAVSEEKLEAALVLSPGKFYKTRDGRKVGPMKSNGCSGFIEKFGDGRVWEDDGTHRKICEDVMKASDDIIAEWEEPAVAVAASNDNGASAKFKVGDRVHASYCGISGNGKVVRVDTDDENMPYLVDIDGHGTLWCYSSSVTAPKASNPAIVALIENGQPKPDSVPHVHASEEAAAKEAKRLAGVHKGQEFGVFVLTSTSQEAAPTYKHEWQRLAAKGEKINAIKELRGLTGLGLKATKDAVEHWLAHDEPYSRIAA